MVYSQKKDANSYARPEDRAYLIAKEMYYELQINDSRPKRVTLWN